MRSQKLRIIGEYRLLARVRRPHIAISGPPATASASNLTPQRTTSTTKDRVPRPANAFILFRADFTKNHTLPDGIERSNGTLSKIACAWSFYSPTERALTHPSASEWKNSSPEGRGFWYRRADEAKIAHQAKYPEYRFRPVSRKSTERKSKELVAARNDSEAVSAVPKEGPPTPAIDDRWMQQCSLCAPLVLYSLSTWLTVPL